MFYIKREINRNQNQYKALFDKGCFDVFSYNVYGNGLNKRIACQLKGYADKEAHDIILAGGVDMGQVLDLSYNYKYSDVIAHEHEASDDYDEMIRKLLMVHVIATEPEFVNAELIESPDINEEE